MLRIAFCFLLVCLGCSAQSDAPEKHSLDLTPEITQRIENHIRAHYNVPATVNIEIGPRKPSEFPGYDELTVSFESGEKKQTFDFILSRDEKKLVRLTKLDLTEDPYAEVMKKIDLKGRPARGNKDAKVVAVNFDDFECPYCSRLHQTIFPELLREYGDRVLFVYKDYPLLEIHPWAMHAAVDANCLAAQNNDAFWDFADYMHGNQRQLSSDHGPGGASGAVDRIALQQGQKHAVDAVKLESCIKAQDESQIKASLKEGDAVGVNATPTLFVNGQELDGAVSITAIRAALDRALTQAGVAVPAHSGSEPGRQSVAPPAAAAPPASK